MRTTLLMVTGMGMRHTGNAPTAPQQRRLQESSSYSQLATNCLDTLQDLGHADDFGLLANCKCEAPRDMTFVQDCC